MKVLPDAQTGCRFRPSATLFLVPPFWRSRGRIMKYVRWIAVCVVVTLALGTMALGASAQSSNEKPKATDVGITDKEIHVAVIADVDSPLAPNLFKAAVDGMQGWAKYINSKVGGGGLAGRKVVIDFYDSKLNPAETKNAEITACQNDVAAVGTSAVFLT